MKHPIYPFSAVLRAIRKEARLKPEDAGERMMYSNYKRWESGRTTVKAEYLELIAEAFSVGNDLWLLEYAWLVDRLTPRPGHAPMQVDEQLSSLAPVLPSREVDLGVLAPFVPGPVTHAELAVACVVARYGPGPSAAGEPIVLQPVKRSKVASPTAHGQSLLSSLYGDVYPEWLQSTALAGMLAGVGQSGEERQEATARRALGMALAPGGLEQLSALMSKVAVTGDERGIDRMPGVAARELPGFTALFNRGMEDLRRLQGAAARKPMSEQDFLFAILELVKGGPEAFLAEDCPIDITKVPDVDPTLTAEGAAMFERMERAFRDAVSEELIDAAATASPAAAVEAIVRVRRDWP